MPIMSIKSKIKKQQIVKWIASLLVSFCLFFVFGFGVVYAGCSQIYCHHVDCCCFEPECFNDASPGNCKFLTCGQFPSGTCCHYNCTYEDECCGSGCFTPNTQVDTLNGDKAISSLGIDEKVVSSEPEVDKETTSVVEKVHEVTRSAYYKIKLQDEKEIEVTGEHPLYAIQKKETPFTFWEYLKTKSLTKKTIGFFVK